MSNAFAASLWGADYLLTLAANWCAGANLHGGQSKYLTAGLVGHTPGMNVAKGPQAMPSGFYTPIRTEPGLDVKAMPVYYGMMLAQQFATTTLLRCDRSAENADLSAYARPHKKRHAHSPHQQRLRGHRCNFERRDRKARAHVAPARARTRRNRRRNAGQRGDCGKVEAQG